MRLTFEPLGEAQLPTLTRWLQCPHVRAFWDDGERDTAAVRAHSFRPGRTVPGFVFSVDGRAAGFIQRQQVAPGHDSFAWAASDGATWGIDLLIADAGLTGQNLGPQVIRAFVEARCAGRPAVQRALVDPSPENTRAIRA